MQPDNEPVELSVSQFVALHNQVLEYAMPEVTIVGELANFRVSKNRWVYFDLKDETASVKFFGTVYQLSGPVEDGMLLRVRGTPRLHPLYGFSVTISSLQPAGEGTIRRAADLLQQKLAAEGLFAPERKRPLPYPPEKIGIITSRESAAYADFMKIINARWGGLEITLADVQVQGDAAVPQIVEAIQMFNQLAEPPEVLVITRGGGSAEDLWAFSTEPVTRAVAGSRIPTLVAIGHEVDISLAELAADQRASTPSNAAELLTPDRRHVLTMLHESERSLEQGLQRALRVTRKLAQGYYEQLRQDLEHAVQRNRRRVEQQQQLLKVLDPDHILQRGYAVVRGQDGRVVRSYAQVGARSFVKVQLADGSFSAEVQ
jgi:exodeoxyribonuclease VII large subunit